MGGTQSILGAYAVRTRSARLGWQFPGGFVRGPFLRGVSRCKFRGFPRSPGFSDCSQVAASLQACTPWMGTSPSLFSDCARQSSGCYSLGGSAALSSLPVFLMYDACATSTSTSTRALRRMLRGTQGKGPGHAEEGVLFPGQRRGPGRAEGLSLSNDTVTQPQRNEGPNPKTGRPSWPRQPSNLKKRQVSRWISNEAKSSLHGSEVTTTSTPAQPPPHCNSTALRVRQWGWSRYHVGGLSFCV